MARDRVTAALWVAADQLVHLALRTEGDTSADEDCRTVAPPPSLSDSSRPASDTLGPGCCFSSRVGAQKRNCIPSAGPRSGSSACSGRTRDLCTAPGEGSGFSGSERGTGSTPSSRPPSPSSSFDTDDSCTGLGTSASSGCHSLSQPPSWHHLNESLLRNGFPAVAFTVSVSGGGLLPQPQTVHRALCAVLKQFQSRASLLAELLTSAELAKERQSAVAAGVHLVQQERDDVRADSLRARESAAAAALASSRHRAEAAKKLASLAAKLRDLQSRLKASEASARRNAEDAASQSDAMTVELDKAQKTAERAARGEAHATERCSRVENELLTLRGRLRGAEAASRGSEAAAAAQQARLAEWVDKQERVAQRHADAYLRLRSAYAVSRDSASSDRAIGGALAAACRELKPAQVAALYEAQRETAEVELAACKSENESLRNELRAAQNAAASHRNAKLLEAPGPDGATMAAARVSEAERSAAAAQRALAATQNAAAIAAREAAKRVAANYQRSALLAEDNASLVLQLEGRPSAKQLAHLQRQVFILQRQLDKASDPARELLDSPKPSPSQPSAASSSTRLRIRRDRAVAGMGLEAVLQLPHGVLAELVQDVAVAMGAPDPMELPAAARQLVGVVRAVPRLQSFITDVCKVVLEEGCDVAVAGERGGSRDSLAAPLILRSWLAQLRQGAANEKLLSEVRLAVGHKLGQTGAQRANKDAWGSAEGLVGAIQRLVRLEARQQEASETVRAAEGLLAQQPQELLHRLLTPFQHLFDCPTLDGTVTRMNQVFGEHSEGVNFRRNMAAVLGLPCNASCARLIQTVTQRLCSSVGEESKT